MSTVSTVKEDLPTATIVATGSAAWIKESGPADPARPWAGTDGEHVSSDVIEDRLVRRQARLVRFGHVLQG